MGTARRAAWTFRFLHLMAAAVGGPGTPDGVTFMVVRSLAPPGESDRIAGHARSHLVNGATPVIVEGSFDAIAVTLADSGRYAGLAP